MRYLWYAMYAFATTLALYALFFRPAQAPTTPVSTPVPEQVAQTESTSPVKADVQVALLLDTSSSMDGLVEQARTQLWEMVSELQVDAEDNERTVAVALYQYGNTDISKRDGFVEQLTPLTTDLDMVTVKLYSLRTTGGKEYAPLAIKRAVEELHWDSDDSVQKLIVVAGNEGFGQGHIKQKDAFALAAEHDIAVLPIYCANKGASKSAISSWRLAATLAGTDFESIDPDQEVARIESPFDAQIMEKYRELQASQAAGGTEVSQYGQQAESYIPEGVAVERAVVQSRQAQYQYCDVGAAPAPSAREVELRREIGELNSQRQSYIKDQMKEIPAYQSRPSNLGKSFRKGAKGVLKGY